MAIPTYFWHSVENCYSFEYTCLEQTHMGPSLVSTYKILRLTKAYVRLMQGVHLYRFHCISFFNNIDIAIFVTMYTLVKKTNYHFGQIGRFYRLSCHFLSDCTPILGKILWCHSRSFMENYLHLWELVNNSIEFRFVIQTRMRNLCLTMLESNFPFM